MQARLGKTGDEQTLVITNHFTGAQGPVRGLPCGRPAAGASPSSASLPRFPAQQNRADTVFKNLFESDEAEAARLAAAPEGSTYHSLSSLPVNIRQFPEDLLIALPQTAHGFTDAEGSPARVVVVPFVYRPASHEENAEDAEDAEGNEVEREKPLRHDGSFGCIIVESGDPRYPVGGHRIDVSYAELRRGTIVTIASSDA